MGYCVVVFDFDLMSFVGVVVDCYLCVVYDDEVVFVELVDLCEVVLMEFENVLVVSFDFFVCMMFVVLVGCCVVVV